ncbi:MAG: pilus assembly protein CpaB [Gammaproteobacteria bacterium]|jgi:pilus assembly protein CpaB
MRGLFALVLLVGMGLAGFAVYMVQGFVSQQETALAQERAKTARTVATTQIYAPTRTITYGEQILPEDVMLIDYAVAFVPEGSFATLEDIFPDGEDVLRVALRQMEINEPMLAVKVTQPGGDAGITSRLTRGMRAFTIKVDVASGVSGFLRPSDRVDVYWTGSVSNGSVNPQSFTQLIKSGIEIIAIDQTADGDRSGASIARTVTVQVSPQDVGVLAQAQSSGALTLSLVGDGDDSVNETVLIDQRALLGLAEDPIIAQVEIAPVDRVCTIKTRRGAEVLQIPVPCSN